MAEIKWKEIDDFKKDFEASNILECDRDWLTSKIRRAIEMLEEIETEINETDLGRKKKTLEQHIEFASDIRNKARSYD